MKTNGIREAVCFSAILALLGCTSHRVAQMDLRHEKATSPVAVDQWRGIDPTRISRLLVARSENGGYSFTNLLTVAEPAFVQGLFGDLVHRESLRVKHYMWVGPKLFVFSDESSNILSAFLYWPAGRPNHIFTHCQACRTNGSYRVVWPGSRTPSVTLPGFDDRFQRFLDVWVD